MCLPVAREHWGSYETFACGKAFIGISHSVAACFLKALPLFFSFTLLIGWFKLTSLHEETYAKKFKQDNGGRSSVGRALDCGSSGRGFKSRRSPQTCARSSAG